jgi:hypothetical protein
MRSSNVPAAALVLAATAASGKSVNDSNAQLAPDNPFARESTLPYRCRRSTRSRTSTSSQRCARHGRAAQGDRRDREESAAPTFENTIVAMERSASC